MKDKKVIFSGIQPSGFITLGNYLGALKNWTTLQDEYNCCFSVVDLHAITVRQEPAALRKNSMDLLMQYIACGINPEKNLIFFQSHVRTHAELAWVLGCNVYMGELSRMTQFKDKSKKQGENIGSGLFTYPVLMAADILLYQTDLVPVGVDQKQHLELARDVAIRFNNAYGETFTVPEPYIGKFGAKIMSLQDPTKKMSKSDDNANSYVALLEAPEVILNKFKRAVTDSDTKICRGEGKNGIENLMNIYASVTGKNDEEIINEFEGRGYGDFKKIVGEAVIEELRPVREKYNYLKQNKDYVQNIYKEGAQKALAISSRTVKKVYRKVGFVDPVI